MRAVNHSGTVDISGFKLNYLVEGEGIPVMLIGSTVYYPRVFSAMLKKHLQLIHVDHRGFVPPPFNDLDNSAFDLDVIIEDFEAVRKHLGLENFIVMGHSGHAFMALEYAKKYPQHASSIVLIGVTPDYSDATDKAADGFFEKVASPQRKNAFEKGMSQLPAMIAADPEKRFISFCLAAAAKSWFDYAFDATSLWEGLYTNMQAIDYIWGLVFRDIDITKGLEDFERPVYLALGKYDFLTGPTELWSEVKKHFKDITIKIFEESAHCPQYEESELFDDRLLNWLSEKHIIGN
jgi:proline iminopeptidase